MGCRASGAPRHWACAAELLEELLDFGGRLSIWPWLGNALGFGVFSGDLDLDQHDGL